MPTIETTNLVSAGARIAGRNQRYVLWFYLLNLVLAFFGTAAFSLHAHAILDNSFYADKLLHGFDIFVYLEMLSRPEMGPPNAYTVPAMYFAVLFFLLSMLFMPGVLRGYASDARLRRDEFFHTCGRNLWRFVRLLLFFLVIAGLLAGVLFGVQSAVVNYTVEKTGNGKLGFYIQLSSLAVIFLIMTSIRMWFDLAQTDVVMRDEGQVRKSIVLAFRHARRNLGRLLGSYVLISVIALIVLVVGIWLWHSIVPPSSLLGALLVAQAILILLLVARFWQRASAVAFHLMHTEPVVEMEPAPLVTIPAAPAQEGSAV